MLAAEPILMEAVKRGKDRQKTHEKLRKIALSSKGSLLDMAAQEFALTEEELTNLLKPESLIGLSAKQTNEFLKNEANPLILKHWKNHVKPARINK